MVTRLHQGSELTPRTWVLWTHLGRAKAMPLLDESLAISSEVGMKPLMERVLSRRKLLGA